MGWGALLLLVGGLGAVIYLFAAATDTPFHRAFNRYAADLEKQCRLLYRKETGPEVARKQLLGVLALLFLTLLLQEWMLLLGVMAAAILPRYWYRDQVTKRREQIEKQLDPFLTTLANALKVSPSLGDALATTANLMRAPIKEDLEFVLKEYHLGTPLDQALVNMSERIDSRSFNSALTTILIGRQTGGDLPKILERSAATLREMARLEGVVRTKTAEGKSQAYVLGVIPFFIVVAINGVDPNWLAPLTSNFLGYAVMGGAAALWLAGVLAARKILDVDI
jgi:tight adherence protein B